MLADMLSANTQKEGCLSQKQSIRCLPQTEQTAEHSRETQDGSIHITLPGWGDNQHVRVHSHLTLRVSSTVAVTFQRPLLSVSPAHLATQMAPAQLLPAPAWIDH